eukprot:PLAT8651.2.p1 GENE.PLAT8651.2~~PLAT8651.2.p1  ORF type:complete len:555 (-),score=209.41 PLAT8651.2:124-1788(-)
MAAPSRSGARDSTAIVWFKTTDLRLHDHAPLSTAHARHSAVEHVLCLDPRLFGTLPSGFPKTGFHRARFMMQSINDLRKSLERAGRRLVVRYGRPEVVLPALAAAVGASKVLAFTEFCSEEQAVESAVKRALAAEDVQLQTVWGNTLVAWRDLPWREDLPSMPNVFTSFRKAVEAEAVVRPPLPVPPRWAPLSAVEESELPVCKSELAELPARLNSGRGIIPQLSQLGVPLPDGLEWAAEEGKEDGKLPEVDAVVTAGWFDSRASLRFGGGESCALARLRYYLWDSDAVATYKKTRNELTGGDFSTKFSPWLALGCLSPRMIASELARYERERVKNESTYWVMFELRWRDFFRFSAAKWGTSLFHLTGPARKSLDQEWKRDPAAIRAWTQGRTGYPYVDALMRELRQTGWMSNRGRQLVASFFTKDMSSDWRVGAEWFESQLLDYEPASNYGNWTYVAGVGFDPRHRFFSVTRQSTQFDADGTFMRLWLPELADLPSKQLHEPTALSAASRRMVGYPARPICRLFSPRKRSGKSRGGKSAKRSRRSKRGRRGGA